MPANPIVHWELMGADGDAQKSFYSNIFEWEFDSPEGFDNYHMTSADHTGVAGAVGQGNEHMPSYAAIYFQVDDIDATLETVGSNGGATAVPRTEIPGMVTFALFNDPAGNLVGIVEAETPPAG
ncbi:MAG: VOC family protein [Acidimicrobiia bacterium]